MLTSVRWLNDYLDPPASAEEQADLLTRAGFPLEGSETIAVSDGEDVRQDFEMTSNRGGCVCHVGLAREIAAISGRSLKMPVATPATNSTAAADLVSVTNHDPAGCPLYTARVIRGATVKPSPAWLADRLIARGDIPRNNVVDATNFVLFELGQPTHVFDLATLRGGDTPEIIVRRAAPDEPFLPLGEGAEAVKLCPADLVIADAERAVALAGVKGGGVTAVTEATTDLLLEAATFDPVLVRTTSRRLGIASESSYRFERGVHPGQVEAASARLAELILELAGGELCDGVVSDGAPIPKLNSVTMRPDRCRAILGVPVTDEQMLDGLARLGFEPRTEQGVIACTVPVDRLDIYREIDLIEEVGRMYGHDNIPIAETIEVRVAPPQPSQLARQAVANELVGIGFVEAVTHTLTGERSATPFLPPNTTVLRVDDDRAKAEPALQTSILPGLLRVRRHNLDNGVASLRLFESASTFWRTGDGHAEDARLGLVMDVTNPNDGLRPMRGVLQRLAEVLCGHDAVLEVEADDATTWLEPGAIARVAGRTLGSFGQLASGAAAVFDLDDPVLVADINVVQFFDTYPPEAEAHALPTFPSIERDLSVVVEESVAWAALTGCIDGCELDHLAACEFVTTYRGKQIGSGRKSVTLRLRFRADDRTLVHEEVDPQVDAAVAALRSGFSAEVRK